MCNQSPSPGTPSTCLKPVVTSVLFLIPTWLCRPKSLIFANRSGISCATLGLYANICLALPLKRSSIALISSRLDFGNALLHNLPQSQLSKLQKLQNAAARIVTLSPKRTHITPILQSLHWLPIKDRIVFKILLLIFHCVQGSAPQYNISLVHPYIPARNLRSSTSRALIIPKSTKTWGKEPSHMPGHIYGTAFLKTSRIVNHLSHLRITWKLTCLLIVNFVILFMCKSCLLSSLLRLEHSAEWIWRIISHMNYYYYYYPKFSSLDPLFSFIGQFPRPSFFLYWSVP